VTVGTADDGRATGTEVEGTNGHACSRSIPCGPVTRSRRSCPCCASSASVSSRTPHSAAGSSPDRSAPPTTSPTTTRARPTPRFTGDNFQRNLRAVEEVKAIATEVGATPAQVALAWVLAQGDNIAPIPGTKRVARAEENTAADAVRLSREKIDKLTNVTPTAGDHHSEQQMQMIER
jgi:Aldo/keto reductase family